MDFLCPICKEKLYQKDKSYKCFNKHSFDIAKEGYLNLNLTSSKNTGDEKNMIKARKAFLEKDYYLFLKNELNKIITNTKPNNLLDLACGEGYYTKDFSIKDKIGIDLSKEALKIASKEDKSTTYILKNIFDVPLKDDSLDLIITIFAPLSDEIKRLLKENGYFIMVKPDIDHLFELKEAVYDKPYYNQIKNNEIDGLTLINETKIKETKILDNIDLNNLFKMTPYYHKTSKKDILKLEQIKELKVSFSFIIDLYQNRT